jgi:hypothetical protein
MADLFIRVEGISLVVVWGIIENPSIADGVNVRLSARSENLSIPLETFLRDRFGPTCGAKFTPTGRGEGGALLKLVLPNWLVDNENGGGKELEALVGSQIEKLVFSGE